MTDVANNPERMAEFDGQLEDAHMVGQWKFDAQLQKAIGGPAPAGLPFIWPWQTINDMLLRSCDVLKETSTIRRTLAFSNPGLPSGSTHALLSSVQIVLPGETEWAHSHAISALRFVIEGNPDLYTVVNGAPQTMERHDLILTPAWSWHDHHNDGDTTGIWLDVLDLPMVAALKQIAYRVFDGESQPITEDRRDDADSRPSFLRRPSGEIETANVPPLRLPWSEVERRLSQLAPEEADPFDGHMLEYFDPLTGQSVLPTLSCNAQMLPPGFVGKTKRDAASALCYVIEGSGTTRIEGHPDIEWNERDVFVLPNWVWHSHVNRSKNGRAVLFVVNESPMLEKMGINRRERRD